MSAAESEQQGTGWGILEDLPGDPMIWVLIFSELAAFGLFLGAFPVTRAIHPAVFAAGQAVRDQGLAGLNTVVLVSSGRGAARGNEGGRARDGRATRCRGLSSP